MKRKLQRPLTHFENSLVRWMEWNSHELSIRLGTVVRRQFLLNDAQHVSMLSWTLRSCKHVEHYAPRWRHPFRLLDYQQMMTWAKTATSLKARLMPMRPTPLLCAQFNSSRSNNRASGQSVQLDIVHLTYIVLYRREGVTLIQLTSLRWYWQGENQNYLQSRRLPLEAVSWLLAIRHHRHHPQMSFVTVIDLVNCETVFLPFCLLLPLSATCLRHLIAKSI